MRIRTLLLPVALFGACSPRAGTAPAEAPRPVPTPEAPVVPLRAKATLQALGIDESPIEHVVRLARLAQRAGLDGVVASPNEVRAIREACGDSFVIVTPGIRGGSARHGADDQQRTATPAGAIEAGSSYLVIGRPITAAPDPRAAAEAIAREIAEARHT